MWYGFSCAMPPRAVREVVFSTTGEDAIFSLAYGGENVGKGDMMFRSKTSQFLALAAINLVGLIVLIVGVELILGNWLTPYVVPRNGYVNRSYVYRQNIYLPHKTITYSRDRFGLRGVHEPLQKVELVTVGGSTTDQRLVGDGETWQDVLRAQTGIAVANAGVDGMTSFGHIVSVREWLHRLPNFSPRFYLHLIGGNDAELSSGPKPSDRGGNEASLVRVLRARSFIVTAIENLWFKLWGPRAAGHTAITLPPGHGSDEMVKANADIPKIQDYITEHYKPNLRKLINLHRSRGENVIMVSQPANPALVKWQQPDTYVAAWKTSLGQWAIALGSINAATREICEEAADVCHFIDLADELKLEPADFYDRVHSTASGVQKIGAFLAGHLAFVQRGEKAESDRGKIPASGR
jgi:lysophospholipase L1-like esterase